MSAGKPLAHHTALAVVPSCKNAVAWEKLMALRRHLKDKGYYRWPPHINIFYPFFETVEFEETAKALQEGLRACQPFSVTLNKFGTFGGGRRGVLWLEPYGDNNEHEGAWNGLYHAISSAMLQVNPGMKIPKDFRPHMTVGHFGNIMEAEAAANSVLAADLLEPVTIDVDEVLLMSREGPKGQFIPYWSVPLGESRGGEPTTITRLSGAPFTHMPTEEESWVAEARREGGGRRTARRRSK